ncbi:hypothetical protein BJP62_15960 [Jeongeupia sp. USM3]|nr:hypothetical protein BJP62_15960 [Jeongeupia sp. USM3]
MPPDQTAFARKLRAEATDAERRLWTGLRGRQLGGFRFRRQHPLGPYIVDFVCLDAGLIVELDGGQHASQAQSDENRTHALNRLGFRVLRYWNDQVLRETGAVLADILARLSELPPPQPSPCEGEGE